MLKFLRKYNNNCQDQWNINIKDDSPSLEEILNSLSRQYNNIVPDQQFNILSLTKNIHWKPKNFTTLTQNNNIEVLSSNNDPIIICEKLKIDPSQYRYLVFTACAKAEFDTPLFQIFWTNGKDNFSEESSAFTSIIADSRYRHYAIDLQHKNQNTLTSWTNHKDELSIRIDPLNCEGRCIISSVFLTSENYFFNHELRELCKIQNLRNELSQRYIHGRGIEIGALQNPLPLLNTVDISYVDRLSLEEMRIHYPELATMNLVNPSIISDAHQLLNITDNSYDFCICNHVLEHIQDPVGALKEWLRVLKKSGYLFLAIPDHLNKLDFHREITSLEHLIDDHTSATHREQNDPHHFLEWASSVNYGESSDKIQDIAQKLIEQKYAIHFHVFNRLLFSNLLNYTKEIIPFEVIELISHNYGDHFEHIAIIKKT